MNKKIAIPVATIALAAGTLGITAFASAHANGEGRRGPSQEVKEAIESGDYNTFKEAASGTPLAEKITEENFSKLSEAHKLREEGKHEEAKAIMEELGLKGPKDEQGQKMDSETRAKLDAAMDAGDYNAWKEIVDDKPIASQVTADNFAKFVEAHNLREEGKHEEAKAIMDELGIKPPKHHMKGDKGGEMKSQNERPAGQNESITK